MSIHPTTLAIFKELRARAATHRFPSTAERIRDLERLAHAINKHSDTLLKALEADLGKSAVEAYTSEIGFVLRDIAFARRHLAKWMRPHRVCVPLIARPGRAAIQPEPLGCVLIIGPWNYPLQLLLSPCVGALAAGNTICLKPSELAPATAAAVAALCADCFDPEQVSVVQGASDVAAELCALPFDHIFFTGSTHTGKKVAAAAAANLTPVTLELGGKSPCVVCADAPLRTTARRIMWGKCLNAGQTCVAPDYILAHTSILDPLLDELRKAARSFVPSLQSAHYGRILNEHHFDRLLALMEGQSIFSGGDHDRGQLRIAPTILAPTSWEAPVMQEEIFGPLLPILPFDHFEDALKELTARPKPLAAYLFTKNRSVMRSFTQQMPCGGVCINDTITQVLPADLPFGGVGASGHGRYRGRAGFDCFSNPKAILQRGVKWELPFRYPTFPATLHMVQKVYRHLIR